MVNVPAAPNRGGWLRRARTQPDGGRDARPGDPGWGRPPNRREPWRPFLEGATGLGPVAFRALGPSGPSPRAPAGLRPPPRRTPPVAHPSVAALPRRWRPLRHERRKAPAARARSLP
ncbi:hypothetical protein GCM10018781_21500 [Kitasatospora indigofera]|uniref:Uncharacterized protein n=1 Tax=Kitasatospora indigofera TaxID=67307 RepID=A0A919KNS3_9ACTN|nr:hypothetical protein GCM10018781_21500 [Kitasatospora indigofera]